MIMQSSFRPFSELRLRSLASALMLVSLLATLSGCGFANRSNVATAQSRRPGTAANQGPPAVDVAVAQLDQLQQPQEYTGTTQALREVSIRAQVEGQLLNLNVDVGDRVSQGQTVAQLDDSILTTNVTSAESELSARRAEIARLETQVSEAQKQVRQAELQLRQAQSDARRFRQLASQGAIAEQQAEQSETAARTAQEILRSTQDQVSSRRQEIAIAAERLRSQQAVIDQARQRRAYSVVTSPINGFVTARVNETGNYLQPGAEILKIGDFSRIRVIVQVSDLEVGQIRQGQSAKVRFDGMANQEFTGTVSRISPAANPTSRLVPVEILVPNASQQIGSGLLARVTFSAQGAPKVVIPTTALQASRSGQGRPPGQSGGQRRPPANGQSPPPMEGPTATPRQSPSGQPVTEGTARSATRPGERVPRTGQETGDRPARSGNTATAGTKDSNRGTIFVVTRDGDEATVSARSVVLGQRQDGRVEIVSGLRPGERYVARSGRPLQDGDIVRLSILSER
jgi:multidrug efflux pump subunit AcrA (membrane-fusion protein)